MKFLGDVLKSIFKKSFTQRYPLVKPAIPKGFRGRVIHLPEKCIYCGLCAQFCPSGAITVDVKNKVWKYDYGKCLFCSQCEEVCRELAKRNAIKMSRLYELADYKKDTFVHIDRKTFTPKS